MDSIFVQIPAYKDAEIIPTVRDLFRKARHARDIYVGICWQDRLGSEGGGELDLGGSGKTSAFLIKT